MAITFKSGGVLGNNGGSNGLISASVTVAGDCLVVETEAGTAQTSADYAVTYNGVALSGPYAANTGNWQGALWFLLSPAQGSNTLEFTYQNNLVSTFLAFSYAVYDGVSAYDTSATSTDGTSENTYSSSFSASAAGYAVIAVGRNDGVGGDTPSVASPFTARFGNTSGSGFIWADDIGATSPVTFSATINEAGDSQDHYFISFIPTQGPFAQYDWPVPRAARRGVVASDPQALNTIIIGRPPLAQYDWPVQRPVRRATIVPDLNFLSYIPATVAPPFGPYDWPNPIGRRPPRGVITPDFDLLISFPSGAAEVLSVGGGDVLSVGPGLVLSVGGIIKPFSQTDWPNPRGPLSLRRAIITPDQNFLSYIPATVAPPFAQFDWPVPTRGVRRGGILIPEDLALYSLIAGPPPIAQYDWPVRRAAGRGAFTPDQNFASTLTPVIYAPFAQYDWPVIRAVRRGVIVPDLSEIRTLVTTLPFAQYDWPIPSILKARTPPQWIWATVIPLGVPLPPPPPSQPVPPSTYIFWHASLRALMEARNSAINTGTDPTLAQTTYLRGLFYLQTAFINAAAAGNWAPSRATAPSATAYIGPYNPDRVGTWIAFRSLQPRAQLPIPPLAEWQAFGYAYMGVGQQPGTTWYGNGW